MAETEKCRFCPGTTLKRVFYEGTKCELCGMAVLGPARTTPPGWVANVPTEESWEGFAYLVRAKSRVLARVIRVLQDDQQGCGAILINREELSICYARRLVADGKLLFHDAPGAPEVTCDG